MSKTAHSLFVYKLFAIQPSAGCVIQTKATRATQTKQPANESGDLSWINSTQFSNMPSPDGRFSPVPEA
jgi:hypothetical protein